MIMGSRGIGNCACSYYSSGCRRNILIPAGVVLRRFSLSTASDNGDKDDMVVHAKDVHCCGCGAKLQSQNETECGYIPSDKMDAILQSQDSATICKRCFLLKHYNRSLKVTLNEDDYKHHLQHLRHQKALILCMIDITDFPCSIFPNLVDVIGHRNPVLVIGNKLDMLPDEGSETRVRVKEIIRQGCLEAGFDRANVVGIHLVSAKTGAGIDNLVSDLTDNWGRQGDVYLLGSTNVGKSTLFNQLMEYLCGLPVGHSGGATISRWPGTTIGLVSFPIASWSKRERMKRKAHLQETKVDQAADTWFVEEQEHEQKLQKSQKQPRMVIERHPLVRKQNRLYDSPGAVNPLQVVFLLYYNILQLRTTVSVLSARQSPHPG